jgi:hypothetical protein
MVREGGSFRKIGSIHHAKLFALLAMLKSGGHGRLIHLGQQSVVELHSRIMVARDLFVLFLHQGAGLKFRLVAANLLPEPGLFLLGGGQRLPAPREVEP